MTTKPLSETSIAQKPLHARLLITIPFVIWLAYCLAHGEKRWELIGATIGIVALAAIGDRTKRLLLGLYPMALLGTIYDMMRFVRDVGMTPERVHICDVRAADMMLLPVTVNGVTGTVHDYFQAHPSVILDFVCAVPYGTFIFAAIGFLVFAYVKDDDAMRGFGWTFLVLNLMGFVTYHAFPAGPPWYYHAHGCVADMATKASEGPALARVDAALGIQYFHGFYARSNTVFGAVPSLHCAYPTLILLFGWPLFGKVARSLAVLFFVSMVFGAVYLDHHWIVDTILGVTYTCVAFFVVRKVRRAMGMRDAGAPIVMDATKPARALDGGPRGA